MNFNKNILGIMAKWPFLIFGLVLSSQAEATKTLICKDRESSFGITVPGQAPKNLAFSFINFKKDEPRYFIGTFREVTASGDFAAEFPLNAKGQLDEKANRSTFAYSRSRNIATYLIADKDSHLRVELRGQCKVVDSDKPKN